MSISEVFGEFRCGKTQLSHTMSVIAQVSANVHWISLANILSCQMTLVERKGRSRTLVGMRKLGLHVQR